MYKDFIKKIVQGTAKKHFHYLEKTREENNESRYKELKFKAIIFLIIAISRNDKSLLS